MNLAEVSLAIINRLKADTGSGGLFNAGSPLVTAAYYAATPVSATMPFLVLTFIGSAREDMFTKNGIMRTFQIAAFVPRQSASPDPTARGSDILKRVYGDSSASQLTPTYGLHRHPLSLSDWTATGISFERDNENHTDDAYGWMMDFKFWATK